MGSAARGGDRAKPKRRSLTLGRIMVSAAGSADGSVAGGSSRLAGAGTRGGKRPHWDVCAAAYYFVMSLIGA